MAMLLSSNSAATRQFRVRTSRARTYSDANSDLVGLVLSRIAVTVSLRSETDAPLYSSQLSLLFEIPFELPSSSHCDVRLKARAIRAARLCHPIGARSRQRSRGRRPRAVTAAPLARSWCRGRSQ